jgi:outer membrane protein TolC
MRSATIIAQVFTAGHFFHLKALACLGGLALLVSLGGCSIYHPKPLTEEAVAATLRKPDGRTLQLEAAKIHHPALRSVRIDLRDGINPDEAALIAVLLNPTLRADRDRRGLAQAQLVQAGVLPNPQVSWSNDYVIGGDTSGTINAFGLGASWDVTQLLTLLPKIASAKANKKAVDLDIAWTEWQTAQNARLSTLRIAGLTAQLKAAREGDDALRENVNLLSKATEAHEKTVLDLAAAESTSRAARAAVLDIEKQLEVERIALNRAIGFPPETRPQIEGGVLPAEVAPPAYESLIANLETSRLDLLGLKAGYTSQDEALRAAIIAQVPRINLGFNRATDTSNVQTLGFGISVDIPIFDRNQGNIGTERATRQKLFDEYADRVFQARADIATGLANIRWLNRQIAENQKSVRALEQLVSTAGTALEQGNGDAISYYQTRYDLILKRIEFTQFKVQLAESVVGLEISAGRYLPLQP